MFNCSLRSLFNKRIFILPYTIEIQDFIIRVKIKYNLKAITDPTFVNKHYDLIMIYINIKGLTRVKREY
jgi:hypothetical protein